MMVKKTKVEYIPVGTRVIDDLTGEEATIIGVSFTEGYMNGNKLRRSIGAIGYWLDNDYINGGRHPWEISEIGDKT